LGVIRLLLTNDVRQNLSKELQLQILFAELNYKAREANKTQVSSSEVRAGVVDRDEAISRYKAMLGTDDSEGAFDRMNEKANDLLSFFHDRLKVFLKDEGIRHDVIDACLAMDGADDITLLVKRARALSQTLATEDGKNLIQGFKRANNILSQAETKDGVEYSFGPDIKFAETDVEKALFAALDTAEAAIKPAMASEDFAGAMSAMAAMRTSVDAFFEAVQVNADNDVVRRNRLNLLGRIRDICLSVADLTKLDG
jgi:glycyl-tRNA synthetase beta chain